jgi:hypothetical protein
MPQPAKCRSCSAEILWVEMVRTGAKNPLDAAATADGTVLIDADGSGRVLTGAELEAARAAGTPLRLSHFATCATAATHRKPAVAAAAKKPRKAAKAEPPGLFDNDAMRPR